jgi:uncharacterized protein (DUF2384 family)
VHLLAWARRALGTVAEARDFMTMARPELGGRLPIDAARTDPGSRGDDPHGMGYGLIL